MVSKSTQTNSSINYIDSHCHIDFTEFDNDRDAVIESASEKGIKHIIVPAVEADTWQNCIATCQRYACCHVAIGMHPMFIARHQPQHLTELDQLITLQKPIAVGDFVRLRTGGAAGKVESIRKGKVVVLMGLMKMTANIEDLQHANAPLDIRNTPSVRTNTVNDNVKFESKIDLRGLSKEDALRLLEGFVDKALVSSATNLRIVHGKGTGVLREAVKRKLREYKSVESFWHPPHEEGGDGVTIVAL